MRLKKVTGRSQRTVAVVVDGQQRLTTTSLLLAATWHFGRRLALQADTRGGDDNGWAAAETAIMTALFMDEGSELRLVSSLTDRDLYRSVVFSEDSHSKGSDDGNHENPLLNARRRFDAHLAALVKGLAAPDALVQVCRIVSGSLDLMCPMLVELGGDEPLPALFQTYQEQSLLGVAALLPGVPGRPFRALDLVRNHVMAVHVELELDEQEEVYRRLWLAGLEERAPPGGLESALDTFLSTVGFPPWSPDAAATGEKASCGRFVSEFESRVKKIRMSMLAMAEEDSTVREDDEILIESDLMRKKQTDFSGIELYARFCSYVKELENKAAGETNESSDVTFDSVNAFLEAFSNFLAEIH